MPITSLPTPPSRSDPVNFASRADSFMAALPTFATEANALQADVNSKESTATTAATTATTQATNAANSASAASTSATNAATSATAAQNFAAALTATSTTSLTIGAGSRVFTTQTSKQFLTGNPLFIYSQGSPSNWMYGTVTTYSGSTLTMNITDSNGSGTFTDWGISVSGIKGATGATGGISGGTLTGVLNYAGTVTIASASTTDIASAASNSIIVTGTTTITALGTTTAGAERLVVFSGALTLTHNATSLILPGAANITTVAGDAAYFVSLGSGNWRCTTYHRASVTGSGSLVLATSPALSSMTVNNGYTEQIFAVTGTTPTIAASNGSIQTWTLSGNSTVTDGLANGQSVILGITASSFTVTWPTMTWAKVGGSGTAPTLTSSGINWIVLWETGSTLRGAFLGTT